MSEKPRIAASNYSNSAPLIWSFWKGERQSEVELITDAAPARCAEMLRLGHVDAALTPVIEYLNLKDVSVVPEICIGAKSKVRSVVLALKKEAGSGEIESLKNIGSIALDTSSRTSSALAKIIFREFIGSDTEFLNHPPDIDAMLEKTECALLIGDPALRIDRSKYHVFDMAELWRHFTGFGFVFAFWLVRKESADIVDFNLALNEGLGKMDEIYEFYKNSVPLNKNEFSEYLTRNISYRMEDDLKKGMKLYFELVKKSELIAG